MAKRHLIQICVYLKSEDIPKVRKARGKRGLASDSAYFRVLYHEDVANKKI